MAIRYSWAMRVIVCSSGMVLLMCSWLGCSAPAPRAAPTVPTAELPAVSAAPNEADADEEDPTVPATDPWQVEGLAPPLSPAGPVVCRLSAAQPPSRVIGRLRPGGDEAFTIMGAEMELSLVKGDAQGSGFFRGARDGLHFRGNMNLHDLRLFASRALVFGGWLVVRHNTELTVRGVGDEDIDVGVDPKHLEDVGVQEAPREGISCKELRADKADRFGPWAGLPQSLSARSGWGDLVGDDPVPLSLEPGEAPVALLPASDDDGVAVFDSRGGWTRVASSRQMVLVFGWVPSSRVQTRAEPVEDLGGGFGFGTGGGGSAARPLRCPHPLSIAVELGGERAVALRADPGVELLRQGSPVQGLAQISFYRRHWFRRAADASVWVRDSDLSDCTRNGN